MRGVAGNGYVHLFMRHDGDPLPRLKRAIAAHICPLIGGIRRLVINIQLIFRKVKMCSDIGKAVDTGDAICRVLAHAVENDTDRCLPRLIGTAGNSESALGRGERLVTSQEAEALDVL